MKKLTFFLAITLMYFAGTSMAHAGGNLDARVATVTRSMSTHLGLNEMEYIKLKALNYEHMSKAAEINSMYSNDPDMREMKINELRSYYEKQLGTFLNEKQMESYAIYKANKKNYTAFSAEEI